jgi:hypothetical protein
MENFLKIFKKTFYQRVLFFSKLGLGITAAIGLCFFVLHIMQIYAVTDIQQNFSSLNGVWIGLGTAWFCIPIEIWWCIFAKKSGIIAHSIVLFFALLLFVVGFLAFLVFLVTTIDNGPAKMEIILWFMSAGFSLSCSYCHFRQTQVFPNIERRFWSHRNLVLGFGAAFLLVGIATCFGGLLNAFASFAFYGKNPILRP